MSGKSTPSKQVTKTSKRNREQHPSLGHNGPNTIDNHGSSSLTGRSTGSNADVNPSSNSSVIDTDASDGDIAMIDQKAETDSEISAKLQ